MKTYYMIDCHACSSRLHGVAVTRTETRAYEGRPVTFRQWERAASTAYSADNGRSVYLDCACGARTRANPIKARNTADKACTARCWNARRASCDCECAGAHHGTGAALAGAR
jgi:hypothetical protein